MNPNFKLWFLSLYGQKFFWMICCVLFYSQLVTCLTLFLKRNLLESWRSYDALEKLHYDFNYPFFFRLVYLWYRTEFHVASSLPACGSAHVFVCSLFTSYLILFSLKTNYWKTVWNLNDIIGCAAVWLVFFVKILLVL